MTDLWGSFPTWWVKVNKLATLHATAGEIGTHIAALKIYILLATKVDYQSKSVALSYDDLEIGAGLSRPMIKPAVRRLVDIGVLAVANTRPVTYTLIGSETYPLFAQVPVDLASAALRVLPNRSRSSLAALKLYITLLFVRDRNTSFARIAHETLQSYTGVRPDSIKQGIDHLVNHKLVHVQPEESTSKPGRPLHVYLIRGIVNRRDHTSLSSSATSPSA